MTVDVLPGESSAEFEEVRKSLIAQFAPDGALEMNYVADLARLVWRKQNLATCGRRNGQDNGATKSLPKKRAAEIYETR